MYIEVWSVLRGACKKSTSLHVLSSQGLPDFYVFGRAESYRFLCLNRPRFICLHVTCDVPNEAQSNFQCTMLMLVTSATPKALSVCPIRSCHCAHRTGVCRVCSAKSFKSRCKHICDSMYMYSPLAERILSPSVCVHHLTSKLPFAAAKSCQGLLYMTDNITG